MGIVFHFSRENKIVPVDKKQFGIIETAQPNEEKNAVNSRGNNSTKLSRNNFRNLMEGDVSLTGRSGRQIIEPDGE